MADVVPDSISPPRPARDLSAHAWYALPRVIFSGGNEVELLRGGDTLFPAMRRAIEQAQRDVWLATYIFHDDPPSLLLADALCEAARRGVRVRVVIDGFGSGASLAALTRRFEAADVDLAVFRPLSGWRSWLQPGQLRRLHQKLCVVDDEIGFVGGINVLDDRFDLRIGPMAEPRLDFAVRVRGPVVAPVEQTARAVWTRAAFGQDWRDEMVALSRASQPLKQVRSLLRNLRMPDSRQFAMPNQSSAAPMRAAFVVRDNLRQRRTIERGYVDAIRKARERVDLVCPYFYPGNRFRRALRHAARRGVRVRLLMQGVWDYRAAALAARALYAELLSRGVRIYEYTPAHLHAKVAVVDDDWATVGSSNIDPLSLLLNLEANVIVRDRDFSAALSAEIDTAIAASREVTLAEAGGRINQLRRGFVAWCAGIFMRVAGATGRY